MKAAHVVRAASVLVRRSLGACALALVPGLSFGAVTLSQFAPNPGVLPGGGWSFTPGTTFADPPPPRAWVNGTYGGVPGAKLSVPVTLNGPAGSLAVTVSRAASVSAIVGAAARCLGNPICMTAAAAGAAVLADYFGQDRVTPKDGGGLLRDPGIGKETVTGWQCNSTSFGSASCTQTGETAGEAAANFASAMVQPSGQCVAGGPVVTGSYTVGSAFASSSVEVSYWIRANLCGSSYDAGYVTVRSSSYQRCPASIDPLNPAYSIPAGSAPFADGLCPQARYHHTPITAEAAAALKDGKPPADPGAVAEGAVKGGESMQGEWQPSSGPASQIGTPKTTTQTNPDSTTKTTTQTPTYTYNYGSPNITYNTTTVTVINNAGDVTTIEETTEVPNPATDPENPCVKNPDSIGCAKFGTPEDGTKPTSNQPIAYTPETFASGTCPAAASFTAFGTTRNLEFVPLCDAASSWVRGVVLVCAAALAAFVFVGGLKA